MAEITNALPPPGQDIDLDRFPGKTFWGLFEDEQTAETAIGVISALNVPREDILLLAGEAGRRRINPPVEPTGWMSRIVRAAQELSDFRIFLERCGAAIARGKAILIVRFDDDAKRDRLEALTRTAGGSPAAYTSQWTITEYV